MWVKRVLNVVSDELENKARASLKLFSGNISLLSMSDNQWTKLMDAFRFDELDDDFLFAADAWCDCDFEGRVH